MPTISKKHAFILGTVVFLVCLIPVVHIWSSVGSSWRGIVPEYIEDSSYYYARIHDIVRGHPYIGNPYFIEHKDSIPPAFFVSDSIAAIPLILGVPFPAGIIFNIIFWSEVFVFLLFFIFKQFGTTDRESMVFSVLSWLQVFWLFVRPVAMQVIFPGYALFLLALFTWLKDQDKKGSILFIASSVYCVYVYTYLLHMIAFTFAIVFIRFLLSKDKPRLKKLMSVLITIIIFSIPFIVVTSLQISSSLYAETIHRIGLLSTHIPRMDLYYYGRWVVVVVFLWFISRKWIPSFKEGEKDSIYAFIWITGLALLLASGSNIITGKELELSNHVGRFIIWWFPLAFFAYFTAFLRHYKSYIRPINIYKRVFLFALIVVCVLGMLRNIPRAFPFFRIDKQDLLNIQDYAGPLDWLKENVSEPSVILAGDRFSGYVPIYTVHYVLFHPSGALQLVSDRELEDRYLVSRFLSGGPSRDDIEKDVALYGGAGKALKGVVMQQEFDAMYARYQSDIKPDIMDRLSEFHVGYIVIGSDDTTATDQVRLLRSEETYRDADFVIYKLLP